MVRIRLRRTGKTKQPSYRVVVADSRSPRDGKFIEIIGHYNPVRQPKILEVNADRARYWLGVGAQPSETVVRLFKQIHILDGEGQVIPGAAVEPASAVAPVPAVAEPVTAPAQIASSPEPDPELIADLPDDVVDPLNDQDVDEERVEPEETNISA